MSVHEYGLGTLYEPRMNKQQLSFGFPIRSDKNRDEQAQKIHVAGSLKFRI